MEQFARAHASPGRRGLQKGGDMRFNTDVAVELAHARAKHGEIHSLHEGYAILLEEVDELWSLTKLQDAKRDPMWVYQELIQIAAMAQRIAEDLKL